MKRLLALLLCLPVGACQQKPTPVPSKLHELPFQQLTDVQLGMSLRDLAQHRAITRASNTEYHEQVASYDVVYETADNELVAVSTFEYDKTATAALIRYKQYVQTTYRSLGVQPQCRYQAQRHAVVALYPLKHQVFEVSYQMSDPTTLSIVSRGFRRSPTPAWTAGAPQACVH